MTSHEEVAPDMNSAQDDVGTRLKTAREAAGKSLADISAATRVPTRLLDALERNAVDELPRGPYAIGFARTYARAVGLNETEVANDVRALQHHSSAGVVAAMDAYEPADAKRVPPSSLAWISGGVAVALLAGYLVWRSMLMTPGELTEQAADAPPAKAESQAPAGVPIGPAVPAFADSEVVRIAASGPVWFSLENAEGRSQFDLTLNSGEFYTIRPEQRGLLLRTGRPQYLRIMVGERSLPQLAPDDEVISKVALDGASLARLAVAPPPANDAAERPATATGTPAPASTPTAATGNADGPQ